jgi:NAD(P)-dependent dehydrogenase (short-subunit alcohol dehydrogenase family)
MAEPIFPGVPVGKALVTGCNSGIGFETAQAFCELGFPVILHCRTEEKAEEVRRKISKQHPRASLETLAFDLSDLRAVDRAGRELRSLGSPLAVLVNNAGAVFRTRTLTANGLEAHFGVNYLAGFLLTNLLLPLLSRSPEARIVNVSSVTHRIGRIRFDDLPGEKGTHWLKEYANSKLAVLCFTYALARRLAGTRVTANAVDPGIVSTNIFLKDGTVSKRLLGHWMNRLLKTPRQGAATGIRVAASPDLSGVSGRYYVNGRERTSSRASRDVATGEKLWEITERLVKEIL